MKMTTYLHLVPRLRMRGNIHPLSQCVFMAWFLIKQWICLHGVVLKLRDFTLLMMENCH
jgi:hypothetical protein